MSALFRASVVILGAAAFSCCVAAEFKKVKDSDMKRDGSLCSLPKSTSFGLSIAALVCLTVAQLVGTLVVVVSGHSSRSRSRTRLEKQPATSGAAGADVEGTGRLTIAFLVLSWICFALAAVLLGAGSSMNNGQAYGRGWVDGDCYVVMDGVFGGAAVLVVATVAFILAIAYSDVGRCREIRQEGDHAARDPSNSKNIPNGKKKGSQTS